MSMPHAILPRLRALLGLGPRTSNLPALDENNLLCRELDQNRLLSDYAYTVLDTELTGLSARKEEIVSIGAVRIRGLSIVPGESYSALVRPSIPLPKTSTLIHRITPEAIAEAPPLADVLPGLIEFCKGTLIVGHHVGLDMSFLNRACRTHGVPLVSASAVRFDGQISVFDPRVPTSPCYACLFPPDAPPEETRCALMGVFAPVVGMMGVMQAGEAIKLLTGLHEPGVPGHHQSLAGRLLLLDGRDWSWTTLRAHRSPDCPVCGPAT